MKNTKTRCVRVLMTIPVARLPLAICERGCARDRYLRARLCSRPMDGKCQDPPVARFPSHRQLNKPPGFGGLKSVGAYIKPVNYRLIKHLKVCYKYISIRRQNLRTMQRARRQNLRAPFFQQGGGIVRLPVIQRGAMTGHFSDVNSYVALGSDWPAKPA